MQASLQEIDRRAGHRFMEAERQLLGQLRAVGVRMTLDPAAGQLHVSQDGVGAPVCRFCRVFRYSAASISDLAVRQLCLSQGAGMASCSVKVGFMEEALDNKFKFNYDMRPMLRVRVRRYV